MMAGGDEQKRYASERGQCPYATQKTVDNPKLQFKDSAQMLVPAHRQSSADVNAREHQRLQSCGVAWDDNSYCNYMEFLVTSMKRILKEADDKDNDEVGGVNSGSAASGDDDRGDIASPRSTDL